MKKKCGSSHQIFGGFFAITLIFILVIYSFNRYKLNVEAIVSKDALTASSLAALSIKNLDLKEMGIDEDNIIIKDPNKTLKTFKKHLTFNLKLDDNLNPKKDSFIKSKVKIDSFIIYNVRKDDNYITIYNMTNGSFNINRVAKNSAITPNGKKVTATTIHSKISFKVSIWGNILENTNVSEDVDITRKK